MYVHIPQYTVEHEEPSKYLYSTLYICKDYMYTVHSIKKLFEIKTANNCIFHFFDQNI